MHKCLPSLGNVEEGKVEMKWEYRREVPTYPGKNVEPTLGVGAPTDKVFLIEEVKRPGEYIIYT